MPLILARVTNRSLSAENGRHTDSDDENEAQLASHPILNLVSFTVSFEAAARLSRTC
jgi:hypothetical protein